MQDRVGVARAVASRLKCVDPTAALHPRSLAEPPCGRPQLRTCGCDTFYVNHEPEQSSIHDMSIHHSLARVVTVSYESAL